MKKYIILPFISLLFLTVSCGKDYLDEEPLDFLGASNALVTYDDYKLSINSLYDKVRFEFYSRGDRNNMDYIYGTDLVFDGQPDVLRFTNYIAALNPVGDGNSVALFHWTNFYKIISDVNIVLDRLGDSELTAEQKTLIEAEAKYFRAFSYRTLVYLYGGVPLVTEAVYQPRYNFVRATKEEVLAQVILDLEFASANLLTKQAARPGEVHRLVASHLLSEVYLAAGRYQDAVNAATVVIDHPSTDLMRQRFGTRINVTPGDPYWDLFQRNNQNHASNTETLWAIQFETDIPGGSAQSGTRTGSPVYERHHAPSVRDIVLNGSRPFSWPIGDYTGGRGIGWAISTKYFSNTIWQSDWSNDIRNANHNFVREFKCTNPASPLFGQIISTENPPAGVTVPSRAFYAYQSKVTTAFDHPANLYANPANFTLKEGAGGTYTDQYMFRLAETYLLRAEAYFRLNNLSAAADDINVVRSRSNAKDVEDTNVSIDYILDERMREFGVEEKRRLTLARLGLLYDKVKAHNPYYKDILPHHNLFPIPFAEIERNREAVLKQNDGYPQ
jgi:hypothetical protein